MYYILYWLSIVYNAILVIASITWGWRNGIFSNIMAWLIMRNGIILYKLGTTVLLHTQLTCCNRFDNHVQRVYMFNIHVTRFLSCTKIVNKKVSEIPEFVPGKMGTWYKCMVSHLHVPAFWLLITIFNIAIFLKRHAKIVLISHDSSNSLQY